MSNVRFVEMKPRAKYNFDEDDHFQLAEKKDDPKQPYCKRCKIYLKGHKFTRHGT